MADFGSPVAQNVNPNAGLQTLQSILGIKQAQQNLQTGAIQQQRAQAAATVDTQTAKENQALASLLHDPVASGIVDKDGNPTADGENIILKAAPTTGAESFGKIVQAARSKVDFNNSVNNLNQNEKTEIYSGLAGAAARGDLGEVQRTAQQIVDSKAGTPVYDDYKRIMDTAMNVIGKQAQISPQSGLQAALGMARQVIGANAVVGAGGIANPSPTHNAAGQNQLQNPITGAISNPEMVGGATNPSSPQVAGATAGTVGAMNSDRERANQVSALIAPSKAGISITKEIDDLVDQIKSGKFAAYISKAAASVGASDSTYARQVLEKDLGRLQTAASTGAGSDERARTILSGFPTAESDAETIHNAMDYARGTFKQNLARGALLDKVKTKDPNVQGFQHADDTLTSMSDPLMHEFATLKTPQERIDFYRRHFKSPAQAQDFKNKVAGMGHIIGQ